MTVQNRAPPIPDPEDHDNKLRWAHTRQRRRIIDGLWREDLIRRRRDQIGSVRSAAWGNVDMAANPFKHIATELSTLYINGPPTIRHDTADVDELATAMVDSRLWASMTRFQTWVIGCREYLIRASATEEGELRYRPVPPDLVIAESSPELPDIPVRIRELRLRDDPGGKPQPVWTWDVLDVSDPDVPQYKIILDKDGRDVTSFFLGEPQSGDAYPYRTQAGVPVLPYVLYHAEALGDRMWDWLQGIEVVEGTMTLGVLRSFWLHLAQDASWPQRWGKNVRVVGLETVDQNGRETRQEIVTDPATFLSLEAIQDDQESEVGQFEPGGDPQKLLESLQAWAAWLAHDSGITGSDLLRSSGDPRSGYALSLSNEGKRAAQRRFTPHFMDPDKRLVALSAILLNSAAGTSHAEDGYSVTYSQIPLSPEELRERRANILELIKAGLMSKVDGYMELHPGMSREQAEEEIKRINEERKEDPMFQEMMQMREQGDVRGQQGETGPPSGPPKAGTQDE